MLRHELSISFVFYGLIHFFYYCGTFQLHKSLMVNNSNFPFGFFDELLFLEACLELAYILDHSTIHAHFLDSGAAVVSRTTLLCWRRASLRRPQISSLRFVQQSLVCLRNRHQGGVILAHL